MSEFKTAKRFGVKTPYIFELVEEIRTVQGRKWHSKEKFWSFPIHNYFEVVGIMKKYRPRLAKAMLTSPRWEEYRKKAEQIKEEAEANMKKSKTINSKIQVPCPPNLKYETYQLAGIEYSLNKAASLNADDMGAGKTIEALGVINAKGCTRNVVVCPYNVKINWGRESRKWLVNKDIEVIVLYSTSDFNACKRDDNFLYVINYDILKKVCSDKQFFKKTEIDIVILDEVHMAKNPSAQRSKYSFYLARKAKQKLFLTGTPILNKVDEIYHILNELRPDIWSNKRSFQNTYCKYYDNGYGMVYAGGKNLDKLQQQLRQFVMIRRLKSDILKELPPKRRQIIEIPCDSKYKSVLSNEKKFKKQMKTILSENSDNEYRNFIKEKKAGKFEFIDHVAKVRHDTAVAKVPDVLSFVDNLLESKDKVIIFAHHRDVLAAIHEHYGKSSVLLYGGMSPKKKQESVDRFQEDENVRVFVGGIIPAGVGLTLTAADTVVFAELDWVPGNLTQAEDRAHRKGQINSVMVYHIVLEDSIDYYLADTIVKKQEEVEKSLNTESIDA